MPNMKMSLLEMTQNILSALNSDQVNSIGDTPESLQVAEAIKSTYFNMLGRYDLPEHNQFFNLQPSNDPTKPVLMYRPDGVTRLEWLKYFDTNPADGSAFQTDQYGAYSHDINLDLQNNASGWVTTSTSSVAFSLGAVTFTIPSGITAITVGQTAYAIPTGSQAYMFGTVTGYTGTTLSMTITSMSGAGTFSSWSIGQQGPNALNYPGYKDVHIIPIEEFIQITSQFNPTESDVESFTLTVNENTTQTPDTFTFYYFNDRQPMHCCIVGNNYIIFDSYDNTQDSTLQASKTMAYGWVYPTFEMVDTFVPNLDAQQFPLLLNDAKSLAFYEIKNQPHQKAEEEVSRQVVSLQKWKAIANQPSYFGQLPNFGRHGRGWYP